MQKLSAIGLQMLNEYELAILKIPGAILLMQPILHGPISATSTGKLPRWLSVISFIKWKD